MTRYQKGKRAITGIVGYCATRERVAELRNERWLKLHWQSVQATILEAFYGAEPPLHRFSEPARTRQDAPPRPQTRYQLEVRRQPLRRVVAIFSVRHKMHPKDSGIAGWPERLTCGHTLPVYSAPYKGDRVRYRRCKDCIPQREAKTPRRHDGTARV